MTLHAAESRETCKNVGSEVKVLTLERSPTPAAFEFEGGEGEFAIGYVLFDAIGNLGYFIAERGGRVFSMPVYVQDNIYARHLTGKSFAAYLFMPFALAFDVATAPVQGLLLWTLSHSSMKNH